eukprot:Mycagemm_TRINITY_DN10366_c2_g15::TRINITY_DN10366_c2_g15_i1::g.920::m.920 type:complete len:160 gc:universal TRINITY_DN10366_c2_g15_i1:961-482(-)
MEGVDGEVAASGVPGAEASWLGVIAAAGMSVAASARLSAFVIASSTSSGISLSSAWAEGVSSKLNVLSVDIKKLSVWIVSEMSPPLSASMSRIILMSWQPVDFITFFSASVGFNLSFFGSSFCCFWYSFTYFSSRGAGALRAAAAAAAMAAGGSGLTEL